MSEKKQKKIYVGAVVEISLKERLQEIADSRHLSLSDIIREMIISQLRSDRSAKYNLKSS